MAMQTYILCFSALICLTLSDYWSDRDELINSENSEMLGADVSLSQKEEAVNQVLMTYKFEELDEGFDNPRLFLPSRHFFEAREAIEKSKVFEFIKTVPKGGALHGHSTALLSFDGLYNLTYEENLYACTVDNRLKLKFMPQPSEDELCKWELLQDIRQNNASYDDWLKTQLTLETPNPRDTYEDVNAVWTVFEAIFETVGSMLTYRPLMEKYFYRALKELYDDQVFYLEFRSSLSRLYELDGTEHSRIEVAGIFRDIAEKFKRDYPDFLGVKLIYAVSRSAELTAIEGYVALLHELHQLYPDFLVGFDLVGQEDKGRPLTDFITQLQSVSSEINFVFHAGETNWYGASTDLNLVDAILLGTKRIGHGYAIVKHPLVMALTKAKKIAIEVCPISNQVLMLVEDMRNHPAALLIARGYPLVITYDDPSFWATKGLSYDFYMVFMGMASRNANLKLLKKLSENSLTYSLQSEEEKELAIERWNEKWNQFIDVTYNKLVRYNL